MKKIFKAFLCSLMALSTVGSLASCAQKAEGFDTLVNHIKSEGTFKNNSYELEVSDTLYFYIVLDDAEIYDVGVHYELESEANNITYNYEFNWEICDTTNRAANWSFSCYTPDGKNYKGGKYHFSGDIVAQDYSVDYDFMYDRKSKNGYF